MVVWTRGISHHCEKQRDAIILGPLSERGNISFYNVVFAAEPDDITVRGAEPAHERPEVRYLILMMPPPGAAGLVIESRDGKRTCRQTYVASDRAGDTTMRETGAYVPMYREGGTRTAQADNRLVACHFSHTSPE
jgi:hypothetical protein